MQISRLQPMPAGIDALDQSGPTSDWSSRSKDLLRWIIRRLHHSIAFLSDHGVGLITLVVLLAVLASIPILQLAALGYLLKGSATVARTGVIRRGFAGTRATAPIGRAFIGIVLASIPMWVVASLSHSAELIDPDGAIARHWHIAFVAVALLTFAHLVIASVRGGGLRLYLWPAGSVNWLARASGRCGMYRQTRDRLWIFYESLGFRQAFLVGLRGFLGGLAWLALPASLLAAGRNSPAVGLLGAAILVFVVPLIPFLQVQYTMRGTIRSLFDFRDVRTHFARAPIAFAIATGAVLLAAIPLNLLKIEYVPREAVWLPGLFFVLFMAPGRLLVGWAYHRASLQEAPRGWFGRLSGRLLILATATVYVLTLFLSQYTAWDGVKSLYEQHAFLLPVAF